MEAFVGSQCHSIGVSNFTQKTPATILEAATIPPVLNQVELHALNLNCALVPWCKEHGIQIVNIAADHSIGTAVVSLLEVVQRSIAVISKSATPSRIEANIRLVTLRR
ncbi:aldo keto reductase [Ophiostoma piceae UAMH 11346]|uniref:Aldo keto reductase n=1 Tax=Ophiostoma piceae (strain UAMH 11346) TaxID=1262450 RepID=S3CN18_OPHP1|nr:aldo keto reductase [Ophiostoma piceae UAMH 11346]